MDLQNLYMLAVDGAVYIATKWGVKSLGVEKTLDDVTGVKGSMPRETYLNDAVMFMASKWLYQNYVYDMLMGVMPSTGWIGMDNVRSTLGVAATMTLIRAFQGKANMKTFLNDFVAIGASEMVSQYLTPYIDSYAKDVVYSDVQRGGEGTKPQNVATMNETGQKRMLL